MRMDRLTSSFQVALSDAQSLAVGQDHQFIEAAHILSAMLAQKDGTIGNLLVKAGGDVATLRKRLREQQERMPKVQGHNGDVHLATRVARFLNIADKLAQQRKDKFIPSELFVLALLQDDNDSARLLLESGISKQSLESAIDAVLAVY